MSARRCDVLVLVDPRHPRAAECARYLLPFPRQFGMAHVVREVTRRGDWPDCAAVVLGHEGVAADDARAFVASIGAGVVSFSTELLGASTRTAPTDVLRFADTDHYITLRHEPDEVMRLRNRVNPSASVRVPIGDGLDDWHVLVGGGTGAFLLFSGQAAHAFVVPAAGTAPSERDLLTYAAARLGPGTLTGITLVEALPRTPAGKVDRVALRASGARNRRET